MKFALMIVCAFLASSALAADCVTNSQGKTVCSNGDKAVVVNKNTGTVKSAERNSSGTATTAQSRNGAKAAYNPKTGNAAVSQTDRSGVTTTKTAGGAEVKSRDGVGVAKTADGTTCVKGRNNQGCTKN